jgi:hypothetical protein
MIRYSLRCPEQHRFDAWFGSSGDFDRLKAAGHLTCAVCGGGGVEKDLMAPALAGPGSQRAPDASATEGPGPDLSAPASPAEQALRALRRKIEASAENVGRNFAREARRIHDGEAPERPIWGEARLAEAKALVEDGIPVAPLPWIGRKTN